MPDRHRPVTNLRILAGKAVEGADGHYVQITRAPADYNGPEYLPVPFPCDVGDLVCVSYAITPDEPDTRPILRRVIDMRGAPSRPGGF